MSVLIKGMEMPTDGNETIIRIQTDGTVLDQYGHHLVITAVPVPKHGRLVDADALERRIREEGLNQAEFYADRYNPVVMAYGDCLGKVKSSPTIIPADPIKEETE